MPHPGGRSPQLRLSTSLKNPAHLRSRPNPLFIYPTYVAPIVTIPRASPARRTQHLPQSKMTQQHAHHNRMTSMDLRVGGKYRIGKKIGSGSFGMFSLRLSARDVADKQVTSTSELTSSRARKSPSSSSQSRPSTRSSSTSPRFTSRSREVLECHSYDGTVPSATTTPWSLTCCE